MRPLGLLFLVACSSANLDVVQAADESVPLATAPRGWYRVRSYAMRHTKRHPESPDVPVRESDITEAVRSEARSAAVEGDRLFLDDTGFRVVRNSQVVSESRLRFSLASGGYLAVRSCPRAEGAVQES